MELHRAVIFANGELRNPAALASMLQPEDFLVAADGGLHHIWHLGRQPRLVIGDLDSLSATDLARLSADGVAIQRHPPEKNETDLELALQAVAAAGYTHVWVTAALGRRLDQTLGNVFLLARPEFAVLDIRLVDGECEAFVIRNEALILGQPGDVVSLLPLLGVASGVETEGLRYPLNAETLYPDRTRGISNVLDAPQALVKVAEGMLLCVHFRQI